MLIRYPMLSVSSAAVACRAERLTLFFVISAGSLGKRAMQKGAEVACKGAVQPCNAATLPACMAADSCSHQTVAGRGAVSQAIGAKPFCLATLPAGDCCLSDLSPTVTGHGRVKLKTSNWLGQPFSTVS